METLKTYQQDDGEGEAIVWHETIGDEGGLVITDGVQSLPVVGELSNKTTPDDFRRFEAIAAAYYARRRVSQRWPEL